MSLRNKDFGLFSGGTSGGGGSGTVTSVGICMPTAFNVSNSPITTSGDINVTAAGTAAQYIRGDGQLANFPTSTGGGSSVAYYLNGSISQGTILGNAYYEMSKTPVFGTGTNFTLTGTADYIAQFITDAGDPALLNIPAGAWQFQLYFSANNNTGNPSFYVELYKYDGATFSLIASSSTNPEIISNGTAVDLYNTSLGVPATALTVTDRLAIRVFVNTAGGGRTITFHTEDSNLAEVITTFSTGVTAINGLTAQVQYFATGTTGTNFGIVSATDTHTFNLPDASATARGALTCENWSTFANAQVITSYRALGSTVKSTSLAVPNVTNMIAAGQVLSGGNFGVTAVYVPQAATITGVRFYQTTAGNYTSNGNPNSVALYTYSAGTLTLVASSTDDVNLWKVSSNSWQSKAFDTPYAAAAGLYYIGFAYNGNQTSAPSIGGATAPVSNSNLFDFTNGAKITARLLNSTVPASINISTYAQIAFNYGFWLY